MGLRKNSIYTTCVIGRVDGSPGVFFVVIGLGWPTIRDHTNDKSMYALKFEAFLYVISPNNLTQIPLFSNFTVLKNKSLEQYYYKLKE